MRRAARRLLCVSRGLTTAVNAFTPAIVPTPVHHQPGQRYLQRYTVSARARLSPI
ncbi:hypothetical protein KB20921_19700 [Edwardsiella ictaluri]|nr:hypothetical protein KH20906_19460 [Edwardsiella ictaluri]BEI02709.1 hypothetical protein KB20921_19700 [Edwardsiella ictaluri]BEI06174.1 hypothetical protein KH201010_19600 [Edwardsiella ictaluri]BEI09633.1 hypothetical protein STU22726_19640 [Edwardsiella ictaluri]BEI13111.1 hypothetical protein STU22816_19640 [Edwardsiella ictaluri]